MKLKQRAPMTAVDAYVYGRLGAVSMSPASADKRFRAQLKKRKVVVAGLTNGERRHMHLLAHKYPWRGPRDEARTDLVDDRPTSYLLPRGYALGCILITFSTVESRIDAIESELETGSRLEGHGSGNR